jgi:hypothetical protein
VEDDDLVDVIAEYERDGFGGQFVPEDDGHLQCLTCHRRSHADEIVLHHLRRLEGDSDPADMTAIAAVECPKCHARGTVVLKYGPGATVEEGEVLRLLEKGHHTAP